MLLWKTGTKVGWIGWSWIRSRSFSSRLRFLNSRALKTQPCRETNKNNWACHLHPTVWAYLFKQTHYCSPANEQKLKNDSCLEHVGKVVCLLCSFLFLFPWPVSLAWTANQRSESSLSLTVIWMCSVYLSCSQVSLIWSLIHTTSRLPLTSRECPCTTSAVLLRRTASPRKAWFHTSQAFNFQREEHCRVRPFFVTLICSSVKY